MTELKYTLIDSREQYNDYCNQLEELVMQDAPELDNEIRLLTHLIETWDREHSPRNQMAPVELLQHLMNEHKISASELARNLGKSKSLLSDILSYRKSFSKEMIRDLAAYFKVSQEGFNREYPLKEPNREVTELLRAAGQSGGAAVLHFRTTPKGTSSPVVHKSSGPVHGERLHYQSKSPKHAMQKTGKKH